MDYDGYHSDKTEDMFSEEESTEKVFGSSPEILKSNTSSDSLVDNPFFNESTRIETPNRAVIPKTPLSLVPFITKINGWTSDLETPESSKDRERTLQNDNDCIITESENGTPKNVPVSNPMDEVVPVSPVLYSRKAKKRTKRRIFNRDEVNNSSFDQTIVPEKNSNKENLMKKFKEENIKEKKNNVHRSETLVRKFGNMREYSKSLINSNDDSQSIQSDVQEEDFLLSWKALELADKTHSRKSNKFSNSKKVQKPTGLIPSSKFPLNDDEDTTFLSDDEFIRFSSLKFSPQNLTETLKIEAETSDENFLGFDKKEQKSSRRFLSNFERIMCFDREEIEDNSLSSHENDVLGFTSPERMASIEAAELQRFFCEHLIDEGRELITTLPPLFPDPEYEPIFLPRLIVSVNTGFSTANKKDISIDVEKIVNAKLVLLKEHSIDLLIQKTDKPNIKPEISIENLIKVEEKQKVLDELEVMDFEIIKKENSFERLFGNEEFSISTPGNQDATKMNFEPLIPEKSVIIPQELEQLPAVSEISSSKIEITGFHTGRGKTVDISENILRKTEDIFLEEFDENICPELNEQLTIHAKLKEDLKKIPSNIIQPCSKLSETNFGGFMTGKGKSVKISDNALAKAKSVFKDDFDEVNANISEKVLENVEEEFNENVISKRFKSCENPGFTSGRGKIVNISEKALLHAKKTFDENLDEKNPIELVDISKNKKLTNVITAKKLCTPSSSGFTSGHGKSVNISKDALLKAKSGFNEEFEEEISASNVKKPISKKILSERTTPQSNSKLPDLNFDGFMSGKGKSLRIPEDALKKAKLVFNDDFDDISENCLTEIGNLKTKLESRSGKIHDSAKRKSLIDNITPLGRKKLCTNDLQARKLFDEADREDQELIKAAKYFKDLDQRKNITTKLNNLQNSSGKESLKIITDEVQASTAAFIEDNKDFSPTIKRQNWTSTHHKKISDKFFANNQDSKRPYSLPSSEVKSKEKEERSLKMSLSQNYHESIPDDLIFDSQYSDDDLPIESHTIDEMKLAEAIGKQEKIIQMKKNNREKPRIGSLLKLRKNKNESRITLQEFSGGKLPSVRNQEQLSKAQIDPIVLSMNSMKAASYEFDLMKFYKRSKKNSEIGIELDDEAHLIPSQKHFAGVEEFKRSFFSSPGVDPGLLPRGWLENHYRWIIWKLASMDKFNFQKLPATLSPQNVMSQLKYRYDREIDRSERPAIRRIMEKDDDASKRIVLCVSRIIATSRTSDSNKPISELELTDGWYSIRACIDNPLNIYVNSGKIKEGTKLMIHGAQLMNLEEGCYPLDASENVRLKINTNSTRRVKWMTKLGYQLRSGPMAVKLKDINPNGGMIGKIIVSVARIYPVLYREKTKNGQTIFRNSRCEEKVAIAYEKEYQLKAEAMYSSYKSKINHNSQNNSESNLMIPRDVLPCFKMRVTDGFVTAIVTIWSNAEECSNIFKENNCIAIYNGNTSGKRPNELQINAGRRTIFQELKRHEKCWKNIICQIRNFTSLLETKNPGFSPAYGELDTIGVVVSKGPAPHGMKNFETMNLAYRNDKNEDSYLSVLFWQGISAYGYSEIACVGDLICCINLEWRKSTYRSLPTAFCSERTIISRNPKQYHHLRDEFEELRKRIFDMQVFVMDSAERIQLEVSRKTTGTTPTSNLTPPNKRTSSGNFDTPEEDLRSLSIKNRIEKLKYYGAAPSMSPICIAASSRVSSDFRSPLPGNATMTEAKTSSHKKL